MRAHIWAGTRALLVVTASSAVGLVYFAYLTAVRFPPDIVRLVPLVWLAACLVGWVTSVRALRSNEGKLLTIAALVLNVPNTTFAAIFFVAALMGG